MAGTPCHFFKEEENWKGFISSQGQHSSDAGQEEDAVGMGSVVIGRGKRPLRGRETSSLGQASVEGDRFWSEYRARYQQSLADSEKANLGLFDSIFYAATAGSG